MHLAEDFALCLGVDAVRQSRKPVVESLPEGDAVGGVRRRPAA